MIRSQNILYFFLASRTAAHTLKLLPFYLYNKCIFLRLTEYVALAHLLRKKQQQQSQTDISAAAKVMDFEMCCFEI